MSAARASPRLLLPLADSANDLQCQFNLRMTFSIIRADIAGRLWKRAHRVKLQRLGGTVQEDRRDRCTEQGGPPPGFTLTAADPRIGENDF